MASSSNKTPSGSFPIQRKNRSCERLLLIFVTVIFSLGIYILNLIPSREISGPVLPGAVIILSFWALHIFMVSTKQKGDEIFLPLAFFLLMTGWLEIFRLDHTLAWKQMYWIIIGEAVFISWLLFIKDYRILEDYKYIFLVGAILLQSAVAIFGVEVNGAKLWFDFKVFSIQPVEFIKIFLTVFLASYLKQNRSILERPEPEQKKPFFYRYYVLLFVLWGTAEAILILQRDLGMALLLFGVFMGLFYVTTRRSYLMLSVFILSIGGAFLLYRVFPHVQIRINTWWNPWTDPQGSGYQMIQSLYSLANGGLLGAGLSGGQPYFIPAVHTDFIFVALAEELGLTGALIILSVFLVLIQRMFKTALESSDEFSSFLSLGLAVLFATQVFIIVGGAVKFIPLTGITLPFVSYGGSSVVSNFILLALFLQISEKCTFNGVDNAQCKEMQ